MGFAWNGTCFPDSASALNAFAKSVPSSDASGINSFTDSPTISDTGLVTWSISNRPLTDTAATVRMGTVQLQNCAVDVSQWPLQSLFVPAALFFAAFMGFRTGYRA